MNRSPQLDLRLPLRGGRRKGAGRKPNGRRALVSHAARPKFDRPTAVHVTMRVREEVWNLRSRRAFRRLREALAAAWGRFGLRIVQFSVQGNHVHLIVEANDDQALSRGMQGLAIRIARALNRMMRRSGRVLADHFFSRILKTPTEVVSAIRYVLGNHAHHFGAVGIDPFSSAALSAADRHAVLAPPVGWLLRIGWRRARLRSDFDINVIQTSGLSGGAAAPSTQRRAG
jgi:putative transposase